MSSVPINANATFFAANTTTAVSGQVFKAVSNISLEWGFDIKREVVTGTNLPYYGTGAFKGTAKVESLGSSDNYLDMLNTVQSGIVPTVGMTWRDTDEQGLTLSGARTWTISGKATKFNIKSQKDDAVMYTFDVEMTTIPSVVQS